MERVYASKLKVPGFYRSGSYLTEDDFSAEDDTPRHRPATTPATPSLPARTPPGSGSRKTRSPLPAGGSPPGGSASAAWGEELHPSLQLPRGRLSVQVVEARNLAAPKGFACYAASLLIKKGTGEVATRYVLPHGQNDADSGAPPGEHRRVQPASRVRHCLSLILHCLFNSLPCLFPFLGF